MVPCATSVARAVTSIMKAPKGRGRATWSPRCSPSIHNCFQTESHITVSRSAFPTLGHLGATINQTHTLLLLPDWAPVSQQFTLKYDNYLCQNPTVCTSKPIGNSFLPQFFSPFCLKNYLIISSPCKTASAFRSPSIKWHK